MKKLIFVAVSAMIIAAGTMTALAEGNTVNQNELCPNYGICSTTGVCENPDNCPNGGLNRLDGQGRAYGAGCGMGTGTGRGMGRGMGRGNCIRA